MNTSDRFKSFNSYFFSHATTKKFIEFLLTQAKLVAPHKKGDASFSYKVVQNSADVVLEYPRTIQPLKKFFLPPRETLISFNMSKNEYVQSQVETEKKIFFAVHSYEMEGIKKLDYSFSVRNPESNYLTRRENSLFIGISYNPDEYHIADSVGVDVDQVDGFCLYFYPIENGYIVFEITPEGAQLLSGFGEVPKYEQALNLPDKKSKSMIKYHYNRIPQIFNHVYKSKVWSEVSERCLGCGTCNLLCSTCYCFDVRDEVELNADDGKRERVWDGCTLNTFAEVAGGENFREELSNRTRHRLYRKFKYITDQSNQIHCIGCGRCSRYCPAGINIADIINKLIDDYSDQQKKYNF